MVKRKLPPPAYNIINMDAAGTTGNLYTFFFVRGPCTDWYGETAAHHCGTALLRSGYCWLIRLWKWLLWRWGRPLSICIGHTRKLWHCWCVCVSVVTDSRCYHQINIMSYFAASVSEFQSLCILVAPDTDLECFLSGRCRGDLVKCPW